MAYYIWEVTRKGNLVVRAPVAHSSTLANAKTSARIRAKKGKSSAMVTRGLPDAKTFDVVRIYEHKSGKRLL